MYASLEAILKFAGDLSAANQPGRFNLDLAWTQLTNYESTGVMRTTVADATTDLQLTMGGVVTGALFGFASDQVVTFKLGGTEADRAITCSTVLWSEGVWIGMGSFTSIYVSNSSGSAANVKHLVIGT